MGRNVLLQSCTAAARGKFGLLASGSCSSQFLWHLGVDVNKTRVIPKQWGGQIWEKMGSLACFISLSEGVYSESSTLKVLKPCQAIAGPPFLLTSQTDLHSFSQPTSYWLVAGIWFVPLIIAWESNWTSLLFWNLIMCVGFFFCKTPFTANLKSVVSAPFWTNVFCGFYFSSGHHPISNCSCFSDQWISNRGSLLFEI